MLGAIPVICSMRARRASSSGAWAQNTSLQVEAPLLLHICCQPFASSASQSSRPPKYAEQLVPSTSPHWSAIVQVSM